MTPIRRIQVATAALADGGNDPVVASRARLQVGKSAEHIGQEAIQMQTIVNLVSAGIGAAILPAALGGASSAPGPLPARRPAPSCRNRENGALGAGCHAETSAHP